MDREHQNPGHLRLLPRQRRLPGGGRRDRRRRPGRALHPQEARSRLSPRTRSPTACARAALGTASDLDYVVFYDKPLLKFERLLETYLRFAPPVSRRSSRRCRSGSSRSSGCARTSARSSTTTGTILFTEHHESHAASAFFPSPFERAAILTIDGVGEWATASLGTGRGQPNPDPQGDPLPALARPPLFGLHLLHRVQGEQRRVQADGPGALRRAALRRSDRARADRPPRGRLVQAEPEVLRLLRRPDDDQRAVRAPLRRPAARARERADPAGDGHGRLRSRW